MCLRGGGSLKASLTRVFSLVKFKGCLVGLKAQLTVDGHMLSLREGQSPTKQSGLYVIANAVKQSTCLNGLPRILTNARNDKMAGSCERGGLISHNVLSPYRLIALLTKCSTLVLRLAMNATARFCAKSSTLLSSQARLFASKACFVAPLGLAFTMAEILLSLTIIGVVAAITLPSLTGNINERTWNTQRKALYSRLSQAVALMPNIRGYGSLTTVTAPENGVGGVYYASDAAETFLSAGLSKVFKLNNICDNSHLGDCGLPEYITNLTGGKLRLYDFSKWSDLQFVFSKTSVYGQRFTLDGATAAFETQNGESVLFFYHPLCLDFDTAAVYQRTNRPSLYVQNAYCANFIYDLNGKRGPNTVGKDVGYMTLLYPTERVLVAPVPLAKDVSSSTTFDNAKKLCSSNGEDIRLPNREELMAMKLNQKLFDNDMTFADTTHYSSTIGVIAGNDTRPYEWVMHSAGQSGPHAFLNLNVYSYAVRCVKR